MDASSSSLPPPPSDRVALGWLLVAAALLGALVQVLLPAWQGEDEHWHLEVAHTIARGHLPSGGGEFVEKAQIEDWPASVLMVQRRCPTASFEEIAAWERAVLASMEESEFSARVDWAPFSVAAWSFDEFDFAASMAQQPPAYYLLAGLWLAPFGADDPVTELRLARLLSLPLYLLTVLLAYGLARECFRDERAALLAAAVVAFLPMHVRQAAVVNNDVLARTMAAGILYLSARAARGRIGVRGAVGLVVLCALAPFAKATAVGAVGVAALAVVLCPQRPRRTRAALVAVMALAGALAGIYLWLNDSPVVPRTWGNLSHRLDESLSIESFERIGKTLVGTFGWESRELPLAAYVAAWLFIALGASLAAFSARRVAADGRVVLLCGAAVTMQLLLLVLRGATAGRYFLPALPALGVLVACGWIGLVPERARGRVAAGIAAALVVALAAWIGGGLVHHQWARWGA